MNRRIAILFVGFLFLMALLAVAITIAVPRWSRTSRAGAVPAPAAAPTAGRRIKARLFYVADDGMRLTGVERDVAYGDGTVEQARRIVEAQIAPVGEPLVSAVPTGTKLRAIFVTAQGEAFVDLSREIAANHTGGSTDELLTVYTIVHALTANLPAVRSVQILIDGKQIETLAGHVDLRRPLQQNAAWIQ